MINVCWKSIRYKCSHILCWDACSRTHTCINTLAKSSLTSEPQRVRSNSVGHGPFQTIITSPPPPDTPTVPSCQAQRDTPTLAMQAGAPACGPPTLHFTLIFKPGCSWMRVKVEEGQSSNSLLLSPVPGTCWRDIRPQNNSLCLILPPSSSLTLSSYFTPHKWEIPPSLIRYLSCWRGGVCGPACLSQYVQKGNRSDHSDIWMCVLFVCFFGPRRLKREREMWFHV